MSDHVRVSVVIAVRNGADSIDATLASLVGQAMGNWQAIVIDDGSTDATPQIVQSWQTRDDRISLLRTRHGGVGKARNLGIGAADQDWLFFLDADDRLDPDHLARMAVAATLSDGADILYSDWRLATAEGDESPHVSAPNMDSPFAVTACRCPFPIHAAWVRRASVLAAGGFDSQLTIAEDWDLWQRLARGGARFSHVPGVTARYTLGAGTATSDVATFLESALQVIRRGHGHDARCADGPLAGGMPIERLPAAELNFLAWLVGKTMGMGGDSAALLGAIEDRHASCVSPAVIAASLLSGVTQGLRCWNPDWAALWPRLELPVMQFLRSISVRAPRERLERRIMRHIERQMAHELSAGAPRTLGALHIVTIDARAPIFAISLPAPVERVLGLVMDAGSLVGRFEVAAERLLPASTVARVLGDFGIATLEEPAETGEPNSATDAPSQDWDYSQTEYWEDIFARPDPWDYTNDYERLKYEQTLAALPAGEISQALELACAEGHFTSLLARRVGKLLATDISPTAVARAQARCAGLDNLAFEVLDLVKEEPAGQFDLIVCSEVLYYVGDLADLSAIAAKLMRKLRPGGHILMAHGNLLVDEPDRTGFPWPHAFGAKKIGETFAECTGLQLVSEHMTELYRIHLLKRTDPDDPHREPRRVRLRHAEPLPPAVAKQVRWQGDRPARVAARERMPILAYHRVAVDAPARLSRYAIAADQFEAQLRWLRDYGFAGVSLQMFEDAVWQGAPLPERPVMITFDDGYGDNRTAALPLLRKYGLPATIFLVTDHVGGRAEWDAAYGPTAALLDWDEIRHMAGQDIGFGAHSAAHLPLTGLAPAELVADAGRARKAIEDVLGTACTAFAYPYGEHDEPVSRAMLDGGYALGFTCEPKVWERSDKVMRIPRIEIFSDMDMTAFAARIGQA